MTTATKHSPKAIATMAGMGVAPDAWEVTPIRWETRRRPVRTKVECQTCRGRGVVHQGETASTIERTVCPTCPTGHRYPRRGVGYVYELVERDVEVGIIQWPEGTQHDSRYGSGCNCALCGRQVLRSGMVAFHGRDAEGVPHGMMVGEDCAERLMGIGSYRAGVRDAETGELVRELEKPKPAPKPAAPTITKASKAELEAIVREAIGEDLMSVSVDETRSSIEVFFTFGPIVNDRKQARDFKITARFGAIYKDWHGEKTLWRDRTATDAADALRRALAAAAK